MTDNDVEHFRNIVASLTTDFHDVRRRLMPLFGNVKHTDKQNAYDVLTDLDTEVENKLIKRLRTLDPSVPVVGEEHGGDRTAKRYWLIDPIDGTIHFTRGNPFCTIMMALIEDGVPIVSIIYNIATRDIYYAIKDNGAYKNNKLITTSKRSSKQAMVLTEIGLRNSVNAAVFLDLASQYKLMNMVCAGYEFLMVADGRAEARICLDPFGNDYDFAPGALLVQEAGGIVKDLRGGAFTTASKNFITAASQHIYDDLCTLIVKRGEGNV